MSNAFSQDGFASRADGWMLVDQVGHYDLIKDMALSPDGHRLVTASEDQTARVWDTATGACLAVLRDHKDAVVSTAFSPDGNTIVTASSDKTLKIWDTLSGCLIKTLVEDVR